jgi:hypothetical protein
MNLFFEVGAICRKADALIAQKTAEMSPLLQVQIFGRAQGQIEELQELKTRVGASREVLLEQIKNLDKDWDVLDEVEKQSHLRRLLEIAGLLNYSRKWDAEIAERIVRLSF